MQKLSEKSRNCVKTINDRDNGRLVLKLRILKDQLANANLDEYYDGVLRFCKVAFGPEIGIFLSFYHIKNGLFLMVNLIPSPDTKEGYVQINRNYKIICEKPIAPIAYFSPSLEFKVETYEQSIALPKKEPVDDKTKESIKDKIKETFDKNSIKQQITWMSNFTKSIKRRNSIKKTNSSKFCRKIQFVLERSLFEYENRPGTIEEKGNLCTNIVINLLEDIDNEFVYLSDEQIVTLDESMIHELIEIYNKLVENEIIFYNYYSLPTPVSE